ncbi:Helicase associated domain protein [Streptomyces sp. NPDC002402]
MPDRSETDPPLRLTLRPDQQDAVDSAVRHLRKPHRRGLMVRACGTGKTVIALRTADALQARHLVVVVPSLDLIAQWATASRADGRTEPMMAVCSLKTSRHPVLAEARVATTNSPDFLAAWLARQKGKATVFVTLDSLTKLEQTQHTRSPAPVFDLLVVDEAHRTAGSWNKEWTAVHDAYRIRAERRLYLTATPYEWHGPRLTEDPATDHVVPKPTAATAPEWDAPAHLATMDQIATFGPRLHTYSHADAITDGVLADYQLVIPTITEADLRHQLTDPAVNSAFGPTARRTTALHLAVLKAMHEHDLHHVIVYFQQVADATDFAHQFTHTLRHLAPEQRPDWADDLSMQSINGNHSPQARHTILTQFAKARRAVVTNAQVLGEGVDLPAVDAIVFADRTASVRRIVQALGRGLRKPPTLKNKMASLVIPAYIPPDADPTDLLGTSYEALWLITAALRHHDQTIAARAPRKTAQRLDTDTHATIARRFRFDFTLDPEHIARAMDLIAWPSDGAVPSAPRRAGLAAATRFHAEHGHLRVPADYEDAYGYRLGSFITGQRTAYQNNALTPDWITELEDLGMIWDDHEATWQGHLTTIRAFHADHGHLAIPAQQPGGQFLIDQRALARKNGLSPDRDTQLADLDPDWKLPHGPDWHRKYHLLKHHIETGHHASTLTRDTTVDRITIGSWLHRQLTTWQRLDPGQQQLLTGLGLTPDHIALKPGTSTPKPGRRTRRTFEQTAGLLQMFIDRNGRPPGAREGIDVDGERVLIGPWLCKARTKKSASQLPPGHDQLLAKILGEDWTGHPAPPGQRGSPRTRTFHSFMPHGSTPRHNTPTTHGQPKRAETPLT